MLAVGNFIRYKMRMHILAVTALSPCDRGLGDFRKNHYLCTEFQNRKKVMNLRDIKKGLKE